MGFKIIEEALNGILVIQPDVYEDSRGFFMETYKASEFSKIGISADFIQDNHSCSPAGALRGMHFQWKRPQGKLIRVSFGKAFFAEIDIRKNSPDLGKYFSIELSAENKKMLWVPPGFANGFFALSELTHVQYKCTAEWNKYGESGIRWDSPDVGIKWPAGSPALSEKDAHAQTLSEWLARPESDNFRI